MQQRWWLVAAGIVGVGLAILLVPRPDTGGVVLDGDADGVVQEAAEGNGRTRTISRSEIRTRRQPADFERIGPNPAAAEMMKLRDTPEALYAGRMSGPWAVVRRQLLLTKDEDAKALSDEIEPLIMDLRLIRRDPEAAKSFSVIESETEAMIGRVRGTAWADDEVLASSLERLEGYLEDYHQAVAKAGAEPAGE